MGSKACLEHFFGKVSETLTGDITDKGYDCLWGLVFDLEEALTSFKFKHFF